MRRDCAYTRAVQIFDSIRVGLLLSSVFAVALVVSCDKQETKSPDDDNDKGGNLCTDYKTCDECIAGQQTKGATEGEAETQCGAAVVGCWTTWDKPIVCGDETHDEQPESDQEEK